MCLCMRSMRCVAHDSHMYDNYSYKVKFIVYSTLAFLEELQGKKQQHVIVLAHVTLHQCVSCQYLPGGLGPLAFADDGTYLLPFSV